VLLKSFLQWQPFPDLVEYALSLLEDLDLYLEYAFYLLLDELIYRQLHLNQLKEPFLLGQVQMSYELLGHLLCDQCLRQDLP